MMSEKKPGFYTTVLHAPDPPLLPSTLSSIVEKPTSFRSPIFQRLSSTVLPTPYSEGMMIS